jgi:hypothetical protein
MGAELLDFYLFLKPLLFLLGFLLVVGLLMRVIDRL